MRKSTFFNLLVWLVLIPGTLFLGTHLPGRWYYLTSTLIVLELLIPFFLAFEGRKPQARELAVLAVMCALAVAARVAIPIPNFKAIYAIIMITGISFGPETGFLVGAVSALSSNFFFSQGSYTPLADDGLRYRRYAGGLSLSEGQAAQKTTCYGACGLVWGAVGGWPDSGYLYGFHGTDHVESEKYSCDLSFRLWGKHHPESQHLCCAVSSGQTHAGEAEPDSGQIWHAGILA